MTTTKPPGSLVAMGPLPPLRGEGPRSEPTDTESIRALPSYWAGQVFRSRTEARWAVFFDLLRIEWFFETEGFRLPDGSCYLPDFWLPDFQLWVEVKGNHGPAFRDWERIQQLVEGSDRALLILEGPPRHTWYRRMFAEKHAGETMLMTDWVAWSSKYAAREHRLWSADTDCNQPRCAPPADDEVETAIQAIRSVDLTTPPDTAAPRKKRAQLSREEQLAIARGGKP